jgi:hypothetical protein
MNAATITHDRNRVRNYDPTFVSDDYLISAGASDPIGTNRSRIRRPGSWLDTAAQQLSAIADLDTGWDSHGAAPPRLDIVDGAWSLLRSLSDTGFVPKPHIYPARSGGVQLEWEIGPYYLEIELISEREANFFFSDAASGFEAEGSLRQGESLDEVVNLIDGMYR